MRRPRREHVAGAFSLLEVLLAVGAAAVIAVGLAAVFAAAGDIVTGGQRVSRFSRAAAQIEARLRKDVERMTRDGYLLIRNERVADDSVVPLFEGQLADEQRRRRADEILFFSRGQYATAREAVVEGEVARAESARIYYGHGMPVDPDAAAGFAYEEPSVVDFWGNGGGPGLPADSVLGDQGPNRYAADWTLLRHVTLLRQPRNTDTDVPATPPLGLSQGAFGEMDTQIALQPAASHLFRKLSAVIPDASNFTGFEVRGDVNPRFESGLVDIATTDLTEVRSVVVGMQQLSGNQHNPITPDMIGSENDFETMPDREWAPPPLDLGASQDREILDNIHAWMLEGLPAWSHAEEWDERVRVRAEDRSPNFLGILADPPNSAVETVFRPSDQVMLTSSAFVPHCSEFIVEWSFGEVYPASHVLQGQTVWHGMERYVDLNGDGTLQNAERVALAYDGAHADFDDFAHAVSYRRDVVGPGGERFEAYPVGGYVAGGGPPGMGGSSSAQQSWLIHGREYQKNINDAQLFSFFGYHDPTFDPDDPNRDGDPEDAARSDSLAWAWPEMLRITMSLADPNDPAIEETFQFVIELPETPAP